MARFVQRVTDFYSILSKTPEGGRELHEALEVKTKYADWFSRMCEYGFSENEDYTCFSNLRSKNQHDGQPKASYYKDYSK